MEIIYGFFAVLAGIIFIAYAGWVGYTADANAKAQNLEYARELIKFYNLLYDGDRPDDILPPLTLDEIRKANKQIEKTLNKKHEIRNLTHQG